MVKRLDCSCTVPLRLHRAVADEGVYPISDIRKINDCAWGESYSRSIAVDIRYVLWVTEQLSGATRLLKEMGIS